MFRFTLMSKKNNIAYCENKVSLLAFLTENLQKYIKIKNLANNYVYYPTFRMILQPFVVKVIHVRDYYR